MSKRSGYILRKAAVLLTTVSMLFTSGTYASAGSIFGAAGENRFSDDKLIVKSVQIPKGAIEYAEGIIGDLLSNVIGNEGLYDASIKNYNRLSLGQAYNIMSFDNINETYYFPILEENQIKLILSVSNMNGAWNASLSKDIADKLNQLKDSSGGSDFILYNTDGVLYAENSMDKYTLADINYGKYKTSVEAKDLSYDEKIKEFERVTGTALKSYNILNELDKTIHPGKEAFEEYNNRENRYAVLPETTKGIGRYADNPFSVNTETGKSLNVTDCLVNQQDREGIERGLCWAAAAATVIRYYNGVNNIFAYDLADKMGIAYDDGAGIEAIQEALKLYSVPYKAIKKIISFDQLKANIGEKKPVVIGASSLLQGHAVTIIGYSTSGNTKTFTIWNSGNQQTQVCTYRDILTYFSYAGYLFFWIQTAY